MRKFLDTTLRDVQYALRTIRGAPLVAVTIVSMVALGLGLVAMVFTVLNMSVFRIDEVRNPGELFGVERPRQPGSEDLIPVTRAQFESLRRETNVFSDAFAIVRGNRTRVDGRAMSTNLVTGNFFQVLGISAAMGRTLGPDDDQPGAGRPVVVLSHKGWSRRFESDPAIVGKTVRINGVPYAIVGVTPEGFRGLSVGAPDYWAPLSMARHFLSPNAGPDIGVEVIGRLQPGVTPDAAAAGLTLWASRLPDSKPVGTASRPGPVRLEPRQGTVADDTTEVMLFFAPIFFVFGLVLMIPCANVTNLLLARGVSRQREIGIRLSLGASRWRIVRQLLTENLLLAVLSAAGGLLVSRVAFAAALYAVAETLPPEIGENLSLSIPPVDWRVLLFLLVGSAAATIFFGLAPALRTTRVELVRTMRGEIIRNAPPSRVRNLLITTQVGASAVLLVCAAVFLRSALAAASADPGLRTVDTLTLWVPNEPLRTVVTDAVKGHSAVTAVAASLPGSVSRPGSAIARSGESASATRHIAVGYRLVSAEYFSVLDIPVLRGRGFTEGDRSVDSGMVVVSETTARQLWPDGSALGRVLYLDDSTSETRAADRAPLSSRPLTVAGIVRDVPGFRLESWPLAVVYLPTEAGNAGTILTLRVHGDPDQARAALFDRLSTVDPAIGEISTLRVVTGLSAYMLGIGFWMSVVLGGLALVLTVAGLFSVLSFIVEQRAKEIGVRIALGATTKNITQLVRSQMVRPVAIGLAVGTGLAVALAILIVATLASELGGVVRVLDPVAYVASLACIIAACLLAAWVPAQRAAKIDPIEALRRD